MIESHNLSNIQISEKLRTAQMFDWTRLMNIVILKLSVYMFTVVGYYMQ